MAENDDAKSVLHHYLQEARDAIVWKVDGLDEHEARVPRTPTGNNLLGLLKHCLNVEAGYFGPTFGREFPAAERLVAMDEYDVDPQADWWARIDESKDDLIDLYRQVWAFADETIEQRPLTAPGRVPWWGPEQQIVTLQRIITHVTYDLARHAGQADLMRELHDNTVGWQPQNSNVPDNYDWGAYTARLTELADHFR